MESAGMDAKTFPGVVCQGSPRDQAQHILDQLLCEGKTKECYQRTCPECKGKTEDLKDTIESTFLENGQSENGNTTAIARMRRLALWIVRAYDDQIHDRTLPGSSDDVQSASSLDSPFLRSAADPGLYRDRCQPEQQQQIQLQYGRKSST